jgi:adenylate cyclase
MADEEEKPKEKKHVPGLLGDIAGTLYPTNPLFEFNSDRLIASKTWFDKYRDYLIATTDPYKPITTTDRVFPDWFQKQANPDITNLQEEINNLRREITQKTLDLTNATTTFGNKELQFKELKQKFDELQEKQSLTHILNRVGESGAKKIFQDPKFRTRFQNGSPCKAFVLSIDIRRSTELMLKAREPKQFAMFITALAAALRKIVLDGFGIFDKFTGDGILAIFPDFYSGDDSGYRTINAAIECHEAFQAIYESHRHCFLAVLKDAGLGIGVDYGDVQIVEIGGEFTVVGTPVVYACRMSGAPSYQTLVNQPAYEQLFSKYSTFDFVETEIEMKHEGMTLAYKVTPNGKNHTPVNPEWLVEE